MKSINLALVALRLQWKTLGQSIMQRDQTWLEIKLIFLTVAQDHKVGEEMELLLLLQPAWIIEGPVV